MGHESSEDNSCATIHQFIYGGFHGSIIHECQIIADDVEERGDEHMHGSVR